MIDKDLLEILVCPESHQPLTEADAALVDRVNADIAAGKAKTVADQDVTEAIEGGLVREDGKVLYPIREEIPILLVEEGIRLG